MRIVTTVPSRLRCIQQPPEPGDLAVADFCHIDTADNDRPVGWARLPFQVTQAMMPHRDASSCEREISAELFQQRAGDVRNRGLTGDDPGRLLQCRLGAKELSDGSLAQGTIPLVEHPRQVGAQERVVVRLGSRFCFS